MNYKVPGCNERLWPWCKKPVKTDGSTVPFPERKQCRDCPENNGRFCAEGTGLVSRADIDP